MLDNIWCCCLNSLSGRPVARDYNIHNAMFRLQTNNLLNSLQEDKSQMNEFQQSTQLGTNSELTLKYFHYLFYAPSKRNLVKHHRNNIPTREG